MLYFSTMPGELRRVGPDIIIQPDSSLYLCPNAEYLLLEAISVGTAVEVIIPDLSARFIVKLYGLTVAYCTEAPNPYLQVGHFYTLDNTTRSLIETAFDAGQGQLELDRVTLSHIRNAETDLLAAARNYHLPTLPDTIDLGRQETPQPLSRPDFRLIYQTNPSKLPSITSQSL